MSPKCRTVSTGLVGMVAVPVSARSAAIAERMRNCSNVSEEPQPSAATTPIGDAGEPSSWPLIPGANVASVQQSPITRSRSRTLAHWAGLWNAFMRMRTYVHVASAVIRLVRHGIRADGLRSTLRKLTLPKRQHHGGGKTPLPHGRQWRRHEGAGALARRLRQERTQIHQRSRADIRDLEARYHRLTGGE
jgi:hypothetical protein